MANKWLAHIKKTMKLMKSKGTYAKGKGLKQVIMAAKKTWHSAKKSMGLKGGGDDDDETGVQAGNEMKEVDLKSEPPAATAATAATTPDPEDPVQALGGRRRKTRRRRTSRRR